MKKAIIISLAALFLAAFTYSQMNKNWKLYTKLIDHKGWNFEVYKKGQQFKVIQYTDQVNGYRIENMVSNLFINHLTDHFFFGKMNTENLK